jgi:hypothetical protein
VFLALSRHFLHFSFLRFRQRYPLVDARADKLFELRMELRRRPDKKLRTLPVKIVHAQHAFKAPGVRKNFASSPSNSGRIDARRVRAPSGMPSYLSTTQCAMRRACLRIYTLVTSLMAEAMLLLNASVVPECPVSTGI